MDRKIIATGVLLTGLLVAMPVLAQDQPYQWTSDRPDGHAPAGVKMDYTLPAGDLYFGYRYSQEKYRGTLVGTQPFSDLEILDAGFTSAPLTHDQSIGEIDLRLGLGIGTVEVSMPWVRNEMLNETSAVFYQSSSEVLGDVSVRGLFDVLETDEYRLSFALGATVPTGKIGKKGTTATLTRGVLPYAMQGGSGAVDILAGGTFLVQNEVSSIGAQINYVIRVVDNNKDYRPGDEFQFSRVGRLQRHRLGKLFPERPLRTSVGHHRIRPTHGRIGRPSCELVRSRGRTRLHPDRSEPLLPRWRGGGTSALARVLLPGPRRPEWAATID